MKKHLTLLGVAAMATAVFAGCSNDEIVESYQGEEISFRTRTETRATEMTLDKLGNFSVIARGIHPSGDLYTAYLIGGQDDNGKITAETATKKTGTSSNVWELDRNVYWPSDMEQVLFWAYTTQNKDAVGKENTLISGEVKFDATNGPTIEGFEPAKADLGNDIGTARWNDGDNQKDLLVAFTEQSKSTPNYTSVPLNFKHALSKISIMAVQKDRAGTDHRIVKIKGAWIMNINTKGDLTAGFKWDNDNKTATDNPAWSNLATIGHYGSFSDEPFTLGTTEMSILGTSDGSLMIIPQTIDAWDKQNNENGAYILLLCRVELKHEGATHNGSDYSDIKVEGNNHYHQLFPVNAEEKYDDAEYGFTCVKLPVEWSMGTRYKYTLDICGASSGAGVYPPEISDEMLNALVPSGSQSKIIRTRGGKDVGDPVLDDPIIFTVDVAEWTDAENFNGETTM